MHYGYALAACILDIVLSQLDATHFDFILVQKGGYAIGKLRTRACYTRRIAEDYAIDREISLVIGSLTCKPLSDTWTNP